MRGPVLGLHTDSDSGDSRDAPLVAAALALEPCAAEAAAGALDVPEGGVATRAAVLGRRLARTRAAIRVYESEQARLHERLRERHRRFVIRAGHIGSKEGAAAAGLRREALKQSQAGPCAAPACAAEALPLARFCIAHICSQPGQVLYRPQEGGGVRLWREADGEVPQREEAGGAGA